MMRNSVVVWMMAGSVALAADSNEDGCQDEFAANGACVDVDATVDASSTVGASATVGDSATVGPEVAIGANVVIGTRTTLDGRVAHTSNPLPIGAGTVIGRSVQLGADHVIGTDATIGRNTTAGARLSMANGGSIGSGAQLGTDVNLGENSIVGSLVGLGDFTTLGDNAIVARGVDVLDAPNSAGGANINGIVGPSTSIGAGARIEAGGRVRKEADIGAGAAVESNGRVGRGATIGDGATIFGRVGANATVGAGATVEAGSRVASGGEVCDGQTLPSGETVSGDGTWPIDGCVVSSTCQTIKTSAPSSPSGIYSIDPDGVGGLPAFDAWCDMTRNGGGWTLVMQNNVGVSNPTPNWIQSTTQTTTSGSTSDLESFDTIVALSAWQHIGSEGRVEMGSTAGSPQHQATYSSVVLAGSNYVLTLSGQTVTLGGIAPGLFTYHNGSGWSTSNRDNDANATACSVTYANNAWWYKNCWSGSLWGYTTTDFAYWTSSNTANRRNWGAIWLR